MGFGPPEGDAEIEAALDVAASRGGDDVRASGAGGIVRV